MLAAQGSVQRLSLLPGVPSSEQSCSSAVPYEGGLPAWSVLWGQGWGGLLRLPESFPHWRPRVRGAVLRVQGEWPIHTHGGWSGRSHSATGLSHPSSLVSVFPWG